MLLRGPSLATRDLPISHIPGSRLGFSRASGSAFPQLVPFLGFSCGHEALYRCDTNRRHGGYWKQKVIRCFSVFFCSSLYVSEHKQVGSDHAYRLYVCK